MLNNILLGNNIMNMGFVANLRKDLLQDYKQYLENFQKKFKIFENLEKGTKIGKINMNCCRNVNKETKENTESNEKVVDNNEKNSEKDEFINLFPVKGEYCEYASGFFQKFSRWWNNENFEKTFEYLDEDFSMFAKYLDTVKTKGITNGYFYINNLVVNINKFINKIIPGLYNLKETYIDNNKIKAKVDSIILILIDFKNEMQDLKETSFNNNQMSFEV